MGQAKTPVRIAYFVHDLSDPAVAKRVGMLQAGGAEVVLLGFRRSAAPVDSVAGVMPEDLGRTRDSLLVSRAVLVFRAMLAAPVWSRRLEGARATLARNLEMLLLAWVGRAWARAGFPLTYEVLDVHRLMLGAGLASRALRGLERLLLRGSAGLVVSSPAFLADYFKPRGQTRAQALLVENKVVSLDGAAARRTQRLPPGPPWRIGWYGMIRCRRSLDILTALVRQNPGQVEIEIRGRPALTEFDDFESQVAAAPGVRFHGAYDPVDLPGFYAGVHFAWAIDYFEVGMNSAWLLPNRLYEGQLHGAVAIAERHVETGRWLARHGAGLLLDDPGSQIAPALAALTPAAYAALAEQTAAIPYQDLVCDRAECVRLVDALLAPTAA